MQKDVRLTVLHRERMMIYRDDTLGKIVRVKCMMEEDQPDYDINLL